jgi:hypothetical protein
MAPLDVYVAERFAQFAVALRPLPLAPAVLHHARRAVIDWYAAVLPGAVVPPATLLERALADELDRAAPWRWAGAMRAAALINGAAAHTMEVDDIYRDGIYHPGAPTIPAALALAQARGASGLQFLRAVVAGYEISTRIGAAMGREHYRYWHTPAPSASARRPCASCTATMDASRHAGDIRPSRPVCSRRFAWTRCQSRCMRGAPRRRGSPPRGSRTRASSARSTSSRARPDSAARWGRGPTGMPRSRRSEARGTSRRRLSRTTRAAGTRSPRSTVRWRCSAGSASRMATSPACGSPPIVPR